MTAEEPQLVIEGLGTSVLDWQASAPWAKPAVSRPGAPTAGAEPNSNSGASWDLPSDAEVTQMIVEVLAPADLLVSLTPTTSTCVPRP